MKFYTIIFLSVWLNAYSVISTKSSMDVDIIKSKNLKYKIDGLKLSEISDLVYDKNSSTLFMLSDKGVLFTFNAKFDSKGFKLKALHAYRLRDKSGKILEDNRRDSEGMALDDKGNLYISFERINKIFHFSKNGVMINEVKLPKSLKNIEPSSGNKSFESLAWHKRYGLITALEYPKEGLNRIKQTIYSTTGKEWKLKMENIKRNGISEIEVMDDGNLLVLERAFNWFIGKFEVNLVKLDINSCQTGEYCKKEVILKLKINRFFDMENFEGLTNLGSGRYLLISDDNNNILAITKLVYFKISPKK